MKNITLSLDEELLLRACDYAARRGTSLNGLIREMLTEATSGQKAENWFTGFMVTSEQALGDSQGWKFNRGELYGDRG